MQISKYKTKMVIAVETHSVQQKRKECRQGVRRWEAFREEGGLSWEVKDAELVRWPRKREGILSYREAYAKSGAQEGMGYSGAINNSPRLELECWGGGGEWGAGEEGVAGSWREKTGPVYQAISVLC